MARANFPYKSTAAKSFKVPGKHASRAAARLQRDEKRAAAKATKPKKDRKPDLATQALERLADHLGERRRWDGKSLFMIHPTDPENVDFAVEDDAYNELGHDNARRLIFSVLSNRLGHHKMKHAHFQIDLGSLAKCWEAITEYFEDSDMPGLPEILRLGEVVEQFREAQRIRIANALDKGIIEFDDIQFLFTQGDEVVCTLHGERLAGTFEKMTLHASLYGTYYLVALKVLHNFTEGGVQHGTTQVAIMQYTGLKEIDALALTKLTPEEKQTLTVRGEKYRSFVRQAAYVEYNGSLVQSGYWSNKTFRASGRIMVDASTFRKTDNDQWTQEVSACGIEANNQARHLISTVTSAQNFPISDADLWRTFPFLSGFSFVAKQWGRMAVTSMKPIAWRDDAFDKLVLEEDRKELVQALVEHQGGTFEDIIAGKGGGIIFLLVGSPGQGKTLTAESIAELLHRPLYSISIGELGTDPDKLETRLRQILDVAMVWNAVLLLDEADIFLEQRTSDDIVRNAMVGVFLRLLEYHQGLLFLTTNRPRDLDQAFLSRISVILEFEDADRSKREKIWHNLLTAAKLDTAMAVGLSRHDFNGRQIKNIIRLSQTLAKARKCVVDYTLITDVMTRCQPTVQAEVTLKDSIRGTRKAA